jgi:hypothetical protein
VNVHRVRLADGTERIRVPQTDLPEFLGFEDLRDPTYRAMRRLLIRDGWLTAHRLNRAPKNGFLLPPDFDASLHRAHIVRNGWQLLRENGLEPEATLGKLNLRG